MKRVLKPTGSTFKRQKTSQYHRDQSPAPFRRFPSQKGGILSASKFQPHGQTERKFLDVAVTQPGSNQATSSVQLLNGCAQGTTAVTRVGTRIYMKSLLVRGCFTLTVPTSPPTPWRFLVVYDKESNGAAPVATDVLSADTISSPMNLYKPGRFVILMDEMMHNEQNAGIQAAAYSINRYVKMGLPVLFNNGNAGTVADISSGAIYAFIHSGGQVYTAATLSTMTARIRFEDN